MFVVIAIILAAIATCWVVAYFELDQPVGTPNQSDHDVSERASANYHRYHTSNQFGR